MVLRRLYPYTTDEFADCAANDVFGVLRLGIGLDGLMSIFASPVLQHDPVEKSG